VADNNNYNNMTLLYRAYCNQVSGVAYNTPQCRQIQPMVADFLFERREVGYGGTGGSLLSLQSKRGLMPWVHD
jgi:hypothetical protein